MELTDKVFHHLRVISVEDGCGKPAQEELDVSLSCLDVFLVANIHRLAPIPRERDANQTCRSGQELSTLRRKVMLYE